MPARRTIRITATLACAAGLAAYLTLGNLQTSSADTGDSPLYTALSLAGIALLVCLAGWHALWLLPAATTTFALVYEQHFWTPPPELAGRGGMDYLGWYPSTVIWLLPVGLAITAVLVAIRAYLLTPRGQPPCGRSGV